MDGGTIDKRHSLFFSFLLLLLDGFSSRNLLLVGGFSSRYAKNSTVGTCLEETRTTISFTNFPSGRNLKHKDTVV